MAFEQAVTFFMDATGKMVVVSPDPRYREVEEIHATHSPKTVRGSATVCIICDEAWPCTKWKWADDETFRLIEEEQ